MSFWNCSFYFIIKKMWSISTLTRWLKEVVRILVIFGGMGRARVLIEDFRRRKERGPRSPSPPTMVQRGRTGTLGVIRKLVERCPGEVSTCNLSGRARGRGIPSDSPPHPGERGRARVLPLPPQAPLPTTRVPRVRNMQTSPLRCPTTEPCCLEPNGKFPSPPSMTPMAPLL